LSQELTRFQSADGWEQVKALALDGITSEHSRRSYSKSLDEFRDWCVRSDSRSFSKATVQRYRAHLERAGLAPSSINVKLSAIRKLATEAGDNSLIDSATAGAITRVKGAKRLGTRTGNWLTQAQAEEMLALPDRSTLRGKRDRALLTVLLGCGLRREELAGLRVDHVQQRDGRWAIVDLTGKGKRVRTVPMPSWAKTSIDDWLEAAGIDDGPLLRSVNKADIVGDRQLTPQSVFDIVRKYGREIGVTIAPHDMRRSFAKLAHRGRAAIEQVQLSLGHSSIQTTERYIGVDQDLADAPCDHLGLRV
jgi:site-specific recombinase XerD